MSAEPTVDSPRRPRGRVLTVVAVALAVALVSALALVLAQDQTQQPSNGSSQGPAPEPIMSHPPDDTDPAPTPSQSTSPTPQRPEPTSPEASGPSSSPTAPIPVRQSVPTGEPADAGAGISIRVINVDRVTAGGGGGIGDLAGPAMAVSMRVENGGNRSLALNEVVVTASYGSAGLPAPSVVNDPRQDPLSGALKPGGAASGVYVFSLPEAGSSNFAIQVSYAAGAENVEFTGDLS